MGQPKNGAKGLCMGTSFFTNQASQGLGPSGLGLASLEIMVRQNKKVKNIDPTLFLILGGVYFLQFFDFVKFLLKNLLPGNMPKKRLPDSPPRNKKSQNFILAQETTGHMETFKHGD